MSWTTFQKVGLSDQHWKAQHPRVSVVGTISQHVRDFLAPDAIRNEMGLRSIRQQPDKVLLIKTFRTGGPTVRTKV